MNSVTTHFRVAYALAALAVSALSLALAGFGCGAPAARVDMPIEERAYEGHDREEHEQGKHPEMSGALREMHDVLAPIWHAEKGPDREVKACDAAPKFEEQSAAIDKETPEKPRSDEAGFHAAAQALIKAAGEFKTECAKPAGGRT